VRTKARYRLRDKRNRNTHLVIIRKLTILALIGIMVYTLGLFLFEKPPISNLQDFELLPGKGEKTIKVQNVFNVTYLEVDIVQDKKVYEAFSGKVDKKEINFKIDTLSAGMKDGPAKVIIKVGFNTLLSRSYKVSSYIDTKPPRIDILSLTDKPIQGSTCAVKLKVEDAKDVHVMLENHKYRLYSMDGIHFLALLPVEFSDKAHLQIVALDRAGNLSYKDITLSAQPETRKRENPIYMDLSHKSEPRKLWVGGFIKPSKVNVVASNNGIVLLVDQKQKKVVIDHGLGLMSVYLNLKDPNVKEGQYVEKGTRIAKDSEDLYFGILVQGREVQKSYWFDDKWVKENIDRVLDWYEEKT